MLRMWAYEGVPHTLHTLSLLLALPVQQVQGWKTQEGQSMGVFIFFTAVVAFITVYERFTRCV